MWYLLIRLKQFTDQKKQLQKQTVESNFSIYVSTKYIPNYAERAKTSQNESKQPKTSQSDPKQTKTAKSEPKRAQKRP